MKDQQPLSEAQGWQRLHRRFIDDARPVGAASNQNNFSIGIDAQPLPGLATVYFENLSPHRIADNGDAFHIEPPTCLFKSHADPISQPPYGMIEHSRLCIWFVEENLRLAEPNLPQNAEGKHDRSAGESARGKDDLWTETQQDGTTDKNPKRQVESE